MSSHLGGRKSKSRSRKNSPSNLQANPCQNQCTPTSCPPNHTCITGYSCYMMPMCLNNQYIDWHLPGMGGGGSTSEECNNTTCDPISGGDIACEDGPWCVGNFYGMMLDCDGNCVPSDFCGDGYCDDGTEWWCALPSDWCGYSNFQCFGDGGDC